MCQFDYSDDGKFVTERRDKIATYEKWFQIINIIVDFAKEMGAIRIHVGG